MRRFVSGSLFVAASLAVPLSAFARPNYCQAFLQNYQARPNGALASAKCNICHAGNDKSVRNAYGKDLQKALGKARASNPEALAAMKKIENNPSTDKKTKYVDRIKADKLPAGQ